MRFLSPGLCKRYAALALSGCLLAATSALAGPTYFFSVSEGTNPSNVGIVGIGQVDSDTVRVAVHLIDTTTPNPQYGFLNTGGHHTPFAFTLAGGNTDVTADFIIPAGGQFNVGMSLELLSLNTGGGDATPYGTFGVAIDSSAGNGSVNAYFGNLLFDVTRTGGLSTDDFIANSSGAYFAADLTNGNGAGGGNTGSQAWKTPVPPGTPDLFCVVEPCSTTVPEPDSLTLLAIGLLALVGLSRNRLRASMA